MAAVNSSPLTVLLADPNDMARAGLRALLDTDSRFRVVAEVRRDILASARRWQPDLILVDPRRGHTIDAGFIVELHAAAPASRIVIYTTVIDEPSFLAAMLADARAYLSKEPAGDGEFLEEALALVGRFSARVIDGTVAEQFRLHPAGTLTLTVPGLAVQTLTRREREVLTLSLRGRTDDEIAKHLGIDRKTVEFHMSNARLKLHATTRTQLGAIAREQGIT